MTPSVRILTASLQGQFRTGGLVSSAYRGHQVIACRKGGDCSSAFAFAHYSGKLSAGAMNFADFPVVTLT